MARPNKSKKSYDKRVSGRGLDPLEVAWLETKLFEKFSTKGDFYAAYKTNTGRSQDPERQLQRILNSEDPITPPVRINFAKTLGMTIGEFDAGLKESLGVPSVHPDDDKKRAAERRWQYIQSHPIRGVEIVFILKGAVGFDWFRELLDDARLTFSRDDKSFKLGQLLAASPEPNTKEHSRNSDQPVCSFWEIYEPESGYWFKKIAPAAHKFQVVAGFDAVFPWSLLGVQRVEKLGDLALLTEIGVSLPARAYQAGVEEFVIKFLGDTFSFSVQLSEHGLDALHEFARVQHTTIKNEELIPLGTSFSGVQLLEMFLRQLLPRPKNEKPKHEIGFAGISGPGGIATSFYPVMPKGFMKTPESKQYSFTITMPAKIDIAGRIKELEKKLKSNPADTDAYGELATIYSHEGRLQEAIRCLEIAIKKSQPTTEIYALLGQSLAKFGRFDEAFTYLQKAVVLNPKHALVRTKFGICLNELGKDDDALIHFQEAARLESSNAGFQYNLGMAFGRLTRNSEAAVAFRRVIDLEPENVRAMTLLGFVLKEEGRHTEAAGYFEKATQLDPNFDDAHEHLGIYFAKTNQHEKAIASFQRAIALKETAQRCLFLGASLSELDRWAEAEAALRRVLTLDPDNPVMLVNLAVAVTQLDKPAEAVELCQRAIKIKEDAHAYALLGQSLAGLSHWDEAEAAYRCGLKLEPNHSAMLTNLGAAIATLGRLPEAAETFEQAIRTDPSNVTAQENLARLREMIAKR